MAVVFALLLFIKFSPATCPTYLLMISLCLHHLQINVVDAPHLHGLLTVE